MVLELSLEDSEVPAMRGEAGSQSVKSKERLFLGLIQDWAGSGI